MSNAQEMIARYVDTLDADKVAKAWRTSKGQRIVTENVYALLPSGDYGRGDVREAIEKRFAQEITSSKEAD